MDGSFAAEVKRGSLCYSLLVDARPRRTRHLIFCAHLLACVPFLVFWIIVPWAHDKIPDPNFQQIRAFIGIVVVYLLFRTWLAFKNPPKLEWEYVFPPVDIAVISTLIWMGNRDPLSNIGLLYLFPLAEAAGTFNLRWSVAVAAMVLVGAAMATHGLRSEEPFNAVFRYFFLIVLASLITLLARASSRSREEISVTKDRNHMAMEIHDGVQAHLMTLSKQLELAEMVAIQNPNRAKELAAEGRETARLAADELRYLVKRMRSKSLHEGFVPALQNFVHNLTSRHEIASSFNVIGTPHDLSVEVEHAAFRIAQEAMTNVVRHSQASNVVIEVCYEPTSMTMTIADDGVGFDCSIESEGLDGLRSRAASVGGTLNLESSPGSTKVVAKLPASTKKS